MIERKEVLKYLRTWSAVEDERLLALIDACTQEAYQTVKPKTMYRIVPCKVGANGVTVEGIPFESKRLAAHLKGCRYVAIFAATLGTESDRLLRAAKSEGTAQLMIYQAVLAAITEEVCDNAQSQIAAAEHCRLRSRYSPGYYDLKLETQKQFFELMDITKRIGVTLSESMLMIPSKSVTAFIGVENED